MTFEEFTDNILGMLQILGEMLVMAVIILGIAAIIFGIGSL